MTPWVCEGGGGRAKTATGPMCPTGLIATFGPYRPYVLYLTSGAGQPPAGIECRAEAYRLEAHEQADHRGDHEPANHHGADHGPDRSGMTSPGAGMPPGLPGTTQ